MKQKYLIYTLFGLLAVNMSWDFTSTNTHGEVNLASTASQVIEIEKGKSITIVTGTNSEQTVLDINGVEKTRTSISLKIEGTEGDICGCLVDRTIEVETKDGKFVDLLAVLKAEEEKAKIEDQKKKDAEELAKTEREEKAKVAKAKIEEDKKKAEACIFTDRSERMDCHKERLAEVSAEIQEQGCRNSDSKECNVLIDSYEKHKDAVVSYVDDLLDESEDSEDPKAARRAQRELKALKRSSNSVVKKTVTSLLNTDAAFAQTEAAYARIPMLMQEAIRTGNPMLGYMAKQEEDRLKYMVQNSDVSPYLTRQADTSYKGGLSDDNIQYFTDRNSQLRKALNIESIYPTYTGSQQLGTNGVTPTTINFRGNGFSSTNSSVPGNPASITAGGAVVGQLDLSNLGSSTGAPVGRRLQNR